MLGFVVILLAGLVVLLAAMTLWTIRRLRRPPRRTYASAVARGQPGDPSELPTPRQFRSWSLGVTLGGRALELPVWDIAGDDPAGPVAICTPGWGDSRIGALPRLDALAPVCSRVLAWDPPGQGEAPGRCDLGTREHLALGALIESLTDDARDRGVILFGWSLGAGAAIVGAASRADDASVLAVIAEAPYRLPTTPARNVVRLAGMPWTPNGPAAFAILGTTLGVGPAWRGFDRAEHAARLRCPLLVLHGTADAVCPIDDGRAIAKAAPAGVLIAIEGADHNDLWTDARFRPQCVRAVADFIRGVRLGTGPAPAGAYG
ncbi:MAG: alpha/beta hydrolase [Planctomycetota bacterium]|nr:MAG: alpha/beta hydrolase [Planctomycetota bacterium]